MISAEISFYPLGEENYKEIINQFLEEINKSGLKFSVNHMSTIIIGEPDDIFDFLKKTFKKFSENHKCILKATFSNSCN
jgi:uncharacterized protein YqgV (UPF0045/DUF77 family)